MLCLKKGPDQADVVNHKAGMVFRGTTSKYVYVHQSLCIHVQNCLYRYVTVFENLVNW